MQTTPKTITVNGQDYKVYSDFIARATYAEAQDGTKKALRTSGYLRNEASIKKAIKAIFA